MEIRASDAWGIAVLQGVQNAERPDPRLAQLTHTKGAPNLELDSLQDQEDVVHRELLQQAAQ